jgi:two-component system CheB/CheR fusion protein
VIWVRDNGIGISAEILSRLFEPFVAGTTIERSEGGFGLGLALAKGLVNLHGGSISATSDGVGKGAEFVVRLPLVKAPPVEVSGAPTANGTLCRRVLIIEDSIDSADSLGELLEQDGHQTVVAYNGVEGIAKAHAFQPEVVLCDLGLPDISGYEVARTFRQCAQACPPGGAHRLRASGGRSPGHRSWICSPPREAVRPGQAPRIVAGLNDSESPSAELVHEF